MTVLGNVFLAGSFQVELKKLRFDWNSNSSPTYHIKWESKRQKEKKKEKKRRTRRREREKGKKEQEPKICCREGRPRNLQCSQVSQRCRLFLINLHFTVLNTEVAGPSKYMEELLLLHKACRSCVSVSHAGVCFTLSCRSCVSISHDVPYHFVTLELRLHKTWRPVSLQVMPELRLHEPWQNGG